MASTVTRTLATALACLLPALPAPAAEPEADWRAINLAVTDTLILPGYAAFAASAAALEPASVALCAAPDAGSLAGMQQAFHDAMDDWQSLSHIHFGPITYFNWNFRLQYWPDERGSGTRQLEALLAAADPAALEAESFARQSVGVQGFPALESLLFADDALAQLQQGDYRCRVVQAIASNLADIAEGVHARWRDEFRSTVAGGEDQDYYSDARDATVDFYKALVENLRKYKEQKLDAALGESPEAARVRRAESWRSARSLRNLRLNVAALAALYQGTEPALALAMPPADRELIAGHLEALQQRSNDLPDALAGLVETAAGHARLVQVAAHMDALYEALETGLKNTDLYLGFNSLDGD